MACAETVAGSSVPATAAGTAVARRPVHVRRLMKHPIRPGDALPARGQSGERAHHLDVEKRPARQVVHHGSTGQTTSTPQMMQTCKAVMILAPIMCTNR